MLPFQDRIIDRMSVADIKALAADETRKQLSLDLFDKIFQKYIEQKS